MTGAQMDEDVVICRCGGEAVRVTWKVTECNMFEDKSTPALWEMEKIAWRLSPDNRKRHLGFLTPDEFRQKHPDD